MFNTHAHPQAKPRKLKDFSEGSRTVRTITMILSVLGGIALWTLLSMLPGVGSILAGPQDIIEKALPDYEGIYPAMVQEFAARFAADVKYINREDDAGDHGLRTSKTQYQPIEILDKYSVKVKNELYHVEKIPELETERLVLDAITEEDIPAFRQRMAAETNACLQRRNSAAGISAMLARPIAARPVSMICTREAAPWAWIAWARRESPSIQTSSSRQSVSRFSRIRRTEQASRMIRPAPPSAKAVYRPRCRPVTSPSGETTPKSEIGGTTIRFLSTVRQTARGRRKCSMQRRSFPGSYLEAPDGFLWQCQRSRPSPAPPSRLPSVTGIRLAAAPAGVREERSTPAAAARAA